MRMSLLCTVLLLTFGLASCCLRPDKDTAKVACPECQKKDAEIKSLHEEVKQLEEDRNALISQVDELQKLNEECREELLKALHPPDGP